MTYKRDNQYDTQMIIIPMDMKSIAVKNTINILYYTDYTL